ncbi:hypothetical protein Tco_1213436 [Tanacetum coccineum]
MDQRLQNCNALTIKPENKEFEGENISCSAFRLGTGKTRYPHLAAKWTSLYDTTHRDYIETHNLLSKTLRYEYREEEEMKKHIEIVKDDEVAIDAIPLATKPPVIVEYKIDKDGRMGYFKLIRADGSSKRLEEDYERVLWGDLKVMFKHDIKSKVWRSLQGYKVTVWKLFDNCGIQKMNIKFRGGLLGLKDFKMILRVTTPQICQEGINSWNDPRDFAKLVKAISLPHDVPSTSDRRLIELKNQVQCSMEAHLAPKSSV